jgi:hypothetical protein
MKSFFNRLIPKKRKGLGDKIREAMSIRDIHGNLPTMPFVEEDGTINYLYGQVTCTCISDSKIFLKEFS